MEESMEPNLPKLWNSLVPTVLERNRSSALKRECKSQAQVLKTERQNYTQEKMSMMRKCQN